MDARKPKLTTPQSPLPSTSDLAKALAFYYDSGFNEQGGRRRYNNKSNGPHGHGNGRDNNRGGGRGHGTKGGRIEKKKKSSYDPDKYCRSCQRVGHDINVCRKYTRQQEKEKEKKKDDHGNDPGDDGKKGSSRTEYQPSFAPPYRYSTNTLNLIIKVTHFIANLSQIDVPSNNNNSWIIDLAANAYITPFKSDL